MVVLKPKMFMEVSVLLTDPNIQIEKIDTGNGHCKERQETGQGPLLVA
jgi:hypothetical protein